MAQVRQLAWFKRIRTLAEIRRRGALEMEVDPAQYGGNFVVGKKISFVVRPDRDATLVLLNINSDGKVTVLYPNQPAEARPLASGKEHFIPGNAERLRIEVREPIGMDLQMAFAFDEPPPGLARLHRLQDVDPGDDRLAVIEKAIEVRSGRFTFATGSLRTLKP